MNDHEVALIERAAEYLGITSWTAFIRDSAIERAREVLRQHPPLQGEDMTPDDGEPKMWT